VSKFGLRDISDRLTRSADTEAVVFELLGYLQDLRADWRVTLSFYEVSRDALVRTYERRDRTLLHRDVNVEVDRLPPRLVRKFFHPSAFFNGAARRPLRSELLNADPWYDAEPTDAPGLRDVVPAHDWRSCLCVPILDREDILALLVLTSPQRTAFGPPALDEILPIRNIASLALVKHLQRASGDEPPADDRQVQDATAEFQTRIRQLHDRNEVLEEENTARRERLDEMSGQVETLSRESTAARTELETVKTTVLALEGQNVVATEHRTEAYTQLDQMRIALESSRRSVGFVLDLMHALSEAHDPDAIVHHLVMRIGTRLEIERCSLMLLDEGGETLQVAAQCGMELDLVSKVKVRVGQGVSGWVARHRRPLLVQGGEDAPGLPRRGGSTYNSDSFISVPVLFDGRLVGVLNLSNRTDGERFEEDDLERACVAAAIIATVVGREASQALDGAAEQREAA